MSLWDIYLFGGGHAMGDRIIILDRGFEKKEIAAMGCCPAGSQAPMVK
jgi:hypothetical protein